MYRYLFALLLLGCAVSRPDEKQLEAQLLNRLQSHVQYLADDKLEGRRAGTTGEQLSADYLSRQFSQIGLEPRGNNGYLQAFEINDGRQISPATSLRIEGNELVLMKDFYPLSYSANDSLQALPSIALQESDQPWFFDVKELLDDNRNNPHFNLGEAVYEKAKEAQRKGATAFFVYNSGSGVGPAFESNSRLPALNIPVAYLSRDAALKYLADRSAMIDIKLKTALADKKRTAHNVIGFINNNAPYTVVLGAHYDHLGYGEDRNSRHSSPEPQIHNGADDNASGTAALIELARLLKQSKAKNNNYLFIAFSGEELGLLGSKYFTQNATVPLQQINYMINLDMVGRLNDSTKTLTVGGYGTSPAWGAFYANSKITTTTGLQFKFDSSGTGPSDHTSFYLKDIPVLFYFTGLHSDYHKPSDDADKINYRGQVQIVKHIYSLIEQADAGKNKLAFSKTKEAQTTTTARFSVSLGIMPDYSFSGSGVKVDGVTTGRAAEKAGIKAGDVITALGQHPITSVESYMQALGKFKKGDKTTVQFLRSGQKLSASVEF